MREWLSGFLRRSVSSGDKIVVYTAIFGGYDSLRAQPHSPGTDFVCFTDRPIRGASPWKVIVEEAKYDTPRMSAKWYKLHPHIALAEYRYSIWMDSGVQMRRRRFAQELLSHLHESGIGLMKHPDRNDIFAEAEASMGLAKYEGLPLREQVEHYRAEGYRAENGLFAGTIIVRDHRNEDVCRLGSAWMAENLRWTYQDQLSLPYLLDRYAIVPDTLPYNLHDNKLFNWTNLANAR